MLISLEAYLTSKHFQVPQNLFGSYSFRLIDNRVRAFNQRGLPIRGGIALFDLDATARTRECFNGWVLAKTIDFVQLTLKEEAWSALLASTGSRSYPRGARPFCYHCMRRYEGFEACPRCVGVRTESIEELAKRLL